MPSITDFSGMLLKPCTTFKREKKGSQNHVTLKTRLTRSNNKKTFMKSDNFTKNPTSSENVLLKAT